MIMIHLIASSTYFSAAHAGAEDTINSVLMTEMIVLTQGKEKAVTGPVGLAWWHTCSIPAHWGKQHKSDNRCYRCIFTDYIIKVDSK